MAKEFPTQPFYIQWKRGFSNLVLAPGQFDSNRRQLQLKLRPQTGALEELWVAINDPRGGSFLRNLGDMHDVFGRSFTGQLVLAFDDPDVAPRANLFIAELNPANAHQLFQVVQIGDGPWTQVRSLEQSFGLVPVFPVELVPEDDDPAKPVIAVGVRDERDATQWNLIPETGEITIDEIKYDLDRATADLGLAPRFVDVATVGSSTGQPIKGSKTLRWQSSRSVTLTNSVSNTSGSSFSQTFSVKGGIKDVVEVTSTSQFSVSRSDTETHTDGKTNTQTREESTLVQFDVPAHTTFKYQIRESSGKVNAPYTAKGTFRSSVIGVPPKPVEFNGIFVGVNVVATQIEVVDVTDPNPANHIVVHSQLLHDALADGPREAAE